MTRSAGTADHHVVVVGAALAGFRTVEELRGAGYQGRITLVGAERHLPYDRPPLSKQVISEGWTIDRLRLVDDATLGMLDVDLVLGVSAVGLDTDGRRVHLDSGGDLDYDVLVIATGVSARTLPGQPVGGAFHAVRTIEDGIALRDRLEASSSLLIVGGGFIGAEVAAVARSSGKAVTMVEGLPVPFARTLGAVVGAACADLHTRHGVALHCGSGVAAFTTSGEAGGVVLANGKSYEADCVLVGVGTSANTAWLSGTDLDIANGIACDAGGRATGVTNVFAVGDVAAWTDPDTGLPQRIEHWTSATQQARVVAHAIAGRARAAPLLGMPFFWSDQYGMKIQLLGHSSLADEVRALRSGEDGGTILFGYFSNGSLVAAASFGAPRMLALSRPLIERGAGREETDRVVAKWV